MAEYLISDSTNFSGEWYKPSLEDSSPKRVHGNFIWANRLGKLALFDSFDELKSGPQSLPPPVPIIHGETTSARQITMLQNISNGTTMAMAEAGFKTQESYQTSLCIVGAHVDQQTTYSQIVYRIPGLLLWLGNKGATYSLPVHPSSTLKYEFETSFEEKLGLTKEAMSIELRIARNLPSPFRAKVTIESHGGLKIVPDNPQTLDWFFEETGKMVSLLSLFAGAPMFPDLVSARLPDGRDVSILVALNSKATCAFDQSHEFFILRDSLGSDFKNFVEKWFSIYSKIENPMLLALGILSSSNLWIHVEFIGLMQSLEGFHRALLPGHYVSQVDYGKAVEILVSMIPVSIVGDHRESLKSRLKYGNEYSLRKRLKALVDPLPATIRQLILQGLEIPSAWVHTRNYFTHWNEEGKAQALEGAAMHRASVRIRLLLRVLYLHEIGVPEQVLISALNGTNNESQYLLQLNARSET